MDLVQRNSYNLPDRVPVHESVIYSCVPVVVCLTHLLYFVMSSYAH